MALAILLCHSRGRILLLNDTVIGSLLTALAYLIVGMFFFLTGYGLRESLKAKPFYKESFWQNRVIPFYVDCLIFIAIYTVYRFITGAEVAIVGLVGSATMFDTYVINGWYLQVAMLVYLAFGFAWRFDDKYELPILCGLLILYIMICVVSGAPMTRTQSILGLPLGYMWSAKKVKIDQKLQKYDWLVAVFSFILMTVTIFIGGWYTTGISQLLIKALSVLFFIIFCLCILRCVPIQCKLISFLGKLSLEIYVIHGLFIELFGQKIDTWSRTCMFLMEVLICSIVAARLLHWVINAVNKYIKGYVKVRGS